MTHQAQRTIHQPDIKQANLHEMTSYVS